MAVTSKRMRAALPMLLLCLASGGLSQTVAAGQPDARQLLDRMTEASRSLNYDGVFVYQRGSHMDAMRIIHKAGQGSERERLISLTGHAREVIRNDESVTCIFPDDQAVIVEKSRPHKLLSSQFPQQVAELADSYTFMVEGSDRVADRDAHIVAIKPRDRYRYGYRLWLDKKTGLMLRSDLIGEQGRSLEQFMFTHLEVLEEISDQQLQPTITGVNYSWYENPDDVHTRIEDAEWNVNWMPAGFTISDRADELLADSPRPVHHMVFSDGLAMISVFVEQIGNENGVLIGPSKLGAVNAFARKADGHQIMVVGEVPLVTVRQMADSVSYAP